MLNPSVGALKMQMFLQENLLGGGFFHRSCGSRVYFCNLIKKELHIFENIFNKVASLQSVDFNFIKSNIFLKNK